MKKYSGKFAWMVSIAIIVVEILFDPLMPVINYGNRVHAQVAFPAARAKWDAQHIDHYKYDVYMFTHNSPCIWQANLEVKDGVVTAADRRSDWPEDLSTLDVPVFPVYEPQPNTPFLCNYHNFTMLKLFDEIDAQLQKSSSSLYKVSYDREYGFISQARFGSPGARGLLSGRTWHCCNGFTIANFEVLDD